MPRPIDDEQLLRNVAALALGTGEPPAPAPAPRTAKSESMSWALPGFCGKSRVQTTFGHLPIEALRRRDPLKTGSGEYREVAWIDKIQLDSAFLARHPAANPIFIPKSALGHGVPNCDILVSPAQITHIPGQFGAQAVKSAQALTGLSRIARQSQAGFTYYLFHCGEPTTVSINGVWFDVSP